MREKRSGLAPVVCVSALAFAAALGGCSKKAPDQNEISNANLVTAGTKSTRLIGDAQTQFKVAPTLDAETGADTLVVGIPFSILGKENIFGGVITKVSDGKSEKLGGLKLTDLPPLTVTPKLGKTKDGDILFALMDENDKPLITFPVKMVDEKGELAMVDLSAVGADLDLISMLDPKGEYTQLVTKTALTTAVDFSQSTLVFDVESRMAPVKAAANEAGQTVFTTRWYLRLNTDADPDFVSRPQTAGIGYFKTQRGKDEKITRYSMNGKPIKYYLKNVPAEYHQPFAAAFDAWNRELKEIVGREPLSYEFVDAGDPRAELLVAGDIRYKVVEWDLYNQAGYGGLGPSIANQRTGETIVSNVLIQGPRIIQIYKKWFAASDAARAFNQLGMADEADRVLANAKREIDADLAAVESPKFALKLGASLAFRVNAQRPELQDPLMQRDDFDALPEGYTFESYMPGYFEEMLTHELGHNLGLRHNFRGSLGAEDGPPKLGKVSLSVMDYLSRAERFVDRISDYDRMAIAYGYTGRLPAHTDWFCTDEDGAAGAKPENSPECSKDDGTNDPFSFFEKKLARAVNLLVARDRASAPEWSVIDMNDQLVASIGGILNYANSASVNAGAWTNFFGKAGRPDQGDAAGVKSYVLSRLKAQLCDAGLNDVVAQKNSDDAKAKTSANIKALRSKAADIVKPYKNVGAADLSCD